MNKNKGETCYLKNKEGQYVKVRRVDGELKLCVVDLQEPATSETVIIRQRHSVEGVVEMAFEFRHSRAHVSPKVEENSLKLESSDNNSTLPDSHWFKRINDGGGDIYHLESVVLPDRNICIKSNRNNKPVLGLSLFPTQFIRVTHSRVN